jgi:hypothetical protein
MAEGAAKTTAPPDATALHQFARQYWNGNDEAVHRAVARVTELKPTLTPILHEQGVPDEVVALVLIESAGQPTALSPKGARGIWQFMPYTARRYGLAVTADVDERIEVVKSTVAAARYLHDLYQRFGDWQLAFAAYNAGEQAVEQAVARTGHGDFFRIDRVLPEETRHYVPAVMSAVELLCPALRRLCSYAAMYTFGIYKLRQHSTEILLLGGHGELNALGAHVLVKSLDTGDRETPFDLSCWILVGRWVQRQSGFTRHELAPSRRLELQLETDDIAVELHRRFHIGNKLDRVPQLCSLHLRLLSTTGLLRRAIVARCSRIDVPLPISVFCG